MKKNDCMTAAFFLSQNVNFCLEFGVRSDRARFGKNLTAFNVFTLCTAGAEHRCCHRPDPGQAAYAEHFDACAGGLQVGRMRRDFEFVTDFNDTAFNTAGNNGTAAGDETTSSTGIKNG